MAIFNDTFTESVGNPTLASHTPDTGTSWSLVFRDDAGSEFAVLSTTDVCEVQSDNNVGIIYTADATYPGADYYIEATHSTMGGTGSRAFYYLLRIQDVDNMYAAIIFQGSDTGFFYKKVSGSWSQVGSSFTSPAAGSVVKFQISGTTLTLFDDGTPIASETDSSISAAGKAGLGAGGGAELVVSGNDMGDHIIDDLTIDVVAAADLSVSESDSVTTSDSPTVAPLVIPNLVESDTVTVNDTLTNIAVVTPVTDNDVSESDTVTVGDTANIAPLVIPDLSEADAVTVGDSATLDPLVIPNLSESDTVTVADSATVDPILLEIIESDAVSVTDTPALDPLLLDISEADAVSVADSPSVAGLGVVDLNVTASDTITVTDSLPYGEYRDTVTVTDEAFVELAYNIGESDSVTVADSAALDAILIETAESDAVTIADSASLDPLVLNASVSDSVAVGDSPSVVRQVEGELNVSASDSISVLDSPIVAFAGVSIYYISESDSVTVADSASINRRAAWYNPDSITVNTGSIKNGDIEDTWADDGSRLQLAETIGVPAFDYDFYFYDVPAYAVDVTINGYYEGGPGHQKKIQQYNFTTTNWTDLTADLDDFPTDTSDQTYLFRIFNDADYNNGGEIRLKLVHNTGGINTHNLYIDHFLLGTDPVIRVSEDITIGDSAGLDALQLDVSESEAVTVADAASVNLTIAISESDAVTIADAASLVNSDLSVAEIDTASVTDTATVLIESPFSVTIEQTLYIKQDDEQSIYITQEDDDGVFV